MKVLDLHGTLHDDADRLVENFVLLNPLPVEIITGKSARMIEIVGKVLKKHSMIYEQKFYWNPGSIVVREDNGE